MAQKDNQDFYNESITKYGISAQGVHWNSHSTQYKRFDVLTNFIEDDITESSVIDAGCGMGEYYNYLMDRQLKPKKYIGIDCEKDMINISKKRYPHPDFLVQNIFEDELFSSDYYVCSGALNILEENEFYTFIKKCYEKSLKGFVFNFLKSDSYNNIKKEDVLDFCSKLTPNIQTKDNYLENDFTIFLVKQ